MEEKGLKQRLLQQSVLTFSEWEHCSKISELCKQLDVKLTWVDVLLESYLTSSAQKQLYLECLVHEFETPELVKMIDPTTLEIGNNWNEVFNRNISANTDIDFYNDVIEAGINYPSSYVSLIKETKEPCRNLQNTSIHKKDISSWSVNLEVLCQAVKNNEFLPLDTKLDKLAGKVISFSTIEKILEKQKTIANKWNCTIPVPHFLFKQEKIEPYLLHAILLSQLRIEENIESWLGGVFINSIPKTKTLESHLNIAQKEIKEFIEKTFTSLWLVMKPEKEVVIIERIQSLVSPNVWQKMTGIKETFSKNKFNISLLKLFVANNILSHAQVLKDVLTIVYNIPVNQATSISKQIYGDQAFDQPAPVIKVQPARANEDIPGLGQTMSMPALKKRARKETDSFKVSSFKESAVADSKAKTNTESVGLGQTMSMPAIKKRERQETSSFKIGSLVDSSNTETDAPKKMKSTAAERIKQSLEKSLQKEKESANKLTNFVVDGHISNHKYELLEMKVDCDLLRIRASLTKEYVTEDAVIGAVILQNDNSTNFFEQNLVDILYAQGLLSKDQHTTLNNDIQEEMSVKVPILSSQMNLHIANSVIQYNMTSRDQVQKVLRLQKSLQKLFIPRTLDKIFIATKILSADIIEPLVQKLKQNVKKTADESSSEDDHVSFSVIKSQKKGVSPAYKMVAIGMFLCLSAWSVYNFYDAYYGVVESQQKNTNTNISKVDNDSNKDNDNATTTVIEKNTSVTTQQETEALLKKIKRQHEEEWGKVGNDIDVQKKELEKLSNEKEKASFPINLKNATKIIVLERQKSYGVLASGEFSLDASEGVPTIHIQVQLFDGLQSISYKEDSVKATNDGKFSIVLGPFDKPFAPNLYYVKVVVAASKQHRLTKNFHGIKKDLEWWIPYVHVEKGQKLEDLFAEMKKHRQDIDEWSKQLKQLRGSLDTFLGKTSKEIRQEYTNWEREWLETEKNINNIFLSKIKKYCIPMYPRAEKQAEIMLLELKNSHQQVKSWVTSLELFPPQASSHKWDLEWNKFLLSIKQDQETLKNITDKLKK